ncbi:NAD(P)-binding domain-containing protein [bacterium]|nr:NAD(P)-binding domain-containing protein [bacterium]
METLLLWGAVLTAAFVGVAAYATRFRRRRRDDASRLASTVELGMNRPSGQYPLVDAGACIGCGTCVDACPEGDVLGIVHGKAVVINGVRCIGHGRCAEACPVGAIQVGLGDITKRDDIPLLDEHQQSGVPGLYVAGELSGFALIHNAVQQGRTAARHAAASLGPRPEDDRLDLVVVGAGPAGLSAALTAKELGLRCRVLDQQGPGGTILQYPRRKLVMVQPLEIPLFGRLKRHEYRKEELLEIWLDLHRDQGLDVRTDERVVEIEGVDGDFTVISARDRHRARKVVLALGRRGTPRRLNVPGEDLAKVAYKLIDAEAYADRRVLVVGGGDSAVEAAMGLTHQKGAAVTLSYRKPELLRIKKRNAERMAETIAAGRIDFLGATTVRAIDEEAVVLNGPDGPVIVPNDDVFILAGGIPPFAFLREVGIRFGGDQPDLRRDFPHSVDSLA